MKVLRFLSGGLTSIALLAFIATAGAWVLRASVTRRAEREAAAEESAIATVPVEKGKFEVVVNSTGQLAAVKSVPAIAEVTGQLAKLAPNGSEVKAGDVIAVLDVPRMARRVRDQQRQYQQAVDNLETKRRDLAAEVEKAGIRLAQAKRELEQQQAQQRVELADKRSTREKDAAQLVLSQQRYERQKALADQGLISGREVELADTRIKAQQFGLERETKELELTEARGTADELNKQAAVREAEAEWARALSRQQDEVGGALPQAGEPEGRGPQARGPQGEGGRPTRPGGGAARSGQGSGTRQGGSGGRGGQGGAAGGPGLPPWQGQQPGLGSAVIALQTAKAQLDRVEEELSKAQVKAPADGVIVLEQDSQGRGTQQRELQPGDRVWEGRTVATIADLSQMRVEIELDAGAARQVKRKQRAIVTADAMPRSAFEGEVSEISQTANESTLPGTGMPSGERTFQAKVAIKDLKKAKLRPGMTAQVRIITETIKSAVRVPLECVFEKDERRVVYVKQGGGFREVEVELGPQSSDMVVVAKGLSGSERVSLRDVGRASAQAGMDRGAPPRPPATPVGAGR